MMGKARSRVIQQNSYNKIQHQTRQYNNKISIRAQEFFLCFLRFWAVLGATAHLLGSGAGAGEDRRGSSCEDGWMGVWGDPVIVRAWMM